MIKNILLSLFLVGTCLAREYNEDHIIFDDELSLYALKSETLVKDGDHYTIGDITNGMILWVDGNLQLNSDDQFINISSDGISIQLGDDDMKRLIFPNKTGTIATTDDIDLDNAVVTNLTVLNKFSHGEGSTPIDEGSFASGLDTVAGSVGYMAKVFDHYNKCIYLTKTPILDSTNQMYFVKEDGSNPITIVDTPEEEDIPNGLIYPETDIEIPSYWFTPGAWLSVNQDSHSDYEAIATNYANGILYYTGRLDQLANNGVIKPHADTKNIDMGAVKLLIEIQRDTDNNVTLADADVLNWVNNNGSVRTSQTGGTIINTDTNYVGTHVLNWYSTVFGRRNYSLGNFSLVSGDMNSALGDYSQVSGKRNQAGYMAHAEGNNNRALGFYSHAEGNGTIARGQASHSEGINNIVTGIGSHVDGQYATASNNYSYVWSGKSANSIDTRYGSHGAGTFNINPVDGVDGVYIGNRSLGDMIRSDAGVKTNDVLEVIEQYKLDHYLADLKVTTENATNRYRTVEMRSTDADENDYLFKIAINMDTNSIPDAPQNLVQLGGADIYRCSSVDALLAGLLDTPHAKVQVANIVRDILKSIDDNGGNVDNGVDAYINSVQNSSSQNSVLHSWTVTPSDQDDSEQIDNPISGN